MFERGVAGTSLDDVKAAAGVSSSQLYHYFGARAELAVAMLAAVQGGILLSQVHRETAPLEIALDTMIAHVASLVTAPRGAARRPGSTERPRGEGFAVSI